MLEKIQEGYDIVIGSRFASKKRHINENIVSIDNCSSDTISAKLIELCENEKLDNKIIKDSDYFKNEDVWDDIILKLIKKLN